MVKRIYFDHAATTPISKGALAEMSFVSEHLYANPSSIHIEGARVKSYIEESRKIISECVGTNAGNIIFTSGGTESINTVIRCAVMDLGIRVLITSPIDHPAVLNTCSYYSNYFSIEHIIVDIDAYGRITPEELDRVLENVKERALVCLIHTHNEIGAIQDVAELTKIAHSYGSVVLADTVQSIGSLPINFDELGVDFACASAHKFNGPKGIGFLYLNKADLIKSLLYGGGQERGLRASTENITGIAGMKISIQEAVSSLESRMLKVKEMNQSLRSFFEDYSDFIEFNTPLENYNPKILSVHFNLGVKSDYLLMNLDILGYSLSGGAACSSGSEKASHVMEVLRNGQTGKTIRFSFSHLNEMDEVQLLKSSLSQIMLR